MSDWQLIETAPKDGTHIVLFDSNVSQWAFGHFMADVEWANKGKKPGEWMAQPSWFPLATPTHWQPLPAPPTAQATQ